MVARRLRLPTLIGYLAAGVLIGPYTVGYVADGAIAIELAELGVVLLMFGTGIHFSIKDLLAVRGVAIPGAVGQSLLTTIFGTVVGVLLGWGIVGGLVLGLAISVASTVVLLRALIERGELDSVQGRVAVGWLIVEDLFTIVILVLLPSAAPLLTGAGGSLVEALQELVVALVLAGIFAAIMLVVGMRLVPRILDLVARERSRELFVLAVLTLAIGVSYLGYEVFGVSLALGGFLAGAVVSESDLSHQAAAEATPLRDTFSVLFFVSVGMMVDPGWIFQNPLPVLIVTAVVILVKFVAAYGVVLGLGYPSRIGITVAAALSQVGEFTFILVTLGVTLGLVPDDALQVVVAAALISITLNPLMFRLVDPLTRWAEGVPVLERLSHRSDRDVTTLDRSHPEEALRNHAIVCGHGRVGRLITSALERRGFTYAVITDDRHETTRLRAQGTVTLFGDAANPEILQHAHIDSARVLIVAISDAHAARLIVDRARQVAPRVPVVVRTHSEHERDVFVGMGGDTQAVLGELEVAVQMTRYVLTRFGVSMREAEAIAQGLRGRSGRPYAMARSTFTRSTGSDADPPRPGGV
ncbi:MAG: cation:proton antiporter [Chloroflexi bacterium]|nr:cation:proton antiporter [Chloroflexota bacterium]